jgi:hypothetical protein
MVAARMTAFVTGFGWRPFSDFDAGATGPAFESRQGRKARVWGTWISGRYGDLYERTAVKRPPYFPFSHSL